VPQSRSGAPAVTAAFAALLQRAQPALYGYLRGLLADAEQARDLMQDVFCDAWRAAQQGAAPFDGQGDEQGRRRWLFQVAHHKAVSALRHRSLIRWESLDTSGMAEWEWPDDPCRFEDRVAEAALLRSVLDSLAPEDASCLLLNVVEGYTTAEIAGMVGISQEASKKRLSRAKQRLRAAYFAQDASARSLHPHE
jgi:RNA polymerase sigma-70 factor (ECF subfamily)